MLSRAQEARVREILGSHPPGASPAYCLEHLAASTQIPPGHHADLAAFVRRLRVYGACQTSYGGICNSDGHATKRLLITGVAADAHASFSMDSRPAIPDETAAPLASALVRAGRAGSGQRITLSNGTASESVIP